jgi:hypothetical protein
VYTSADEKRLIEVLDRQIECEAFSSLVSALQPAPSSLPLLETAIALDANAFLRIPSHPKAEDIIDFLSAAHTAPLIIPGQAIQEFWNNQLQAVDTVASTLQKKFDAFRLELGKLDPQFGDYVIRIQGSLDEFTTEYGHLFDEGLRRKTAAFLKMLETRALVPYAPRLRFQELAAQRRRTRTPPGFKDDGDGDFFIWVDLLTGLQRARAKAQHFSRAVLVSGDRKIDWSRNGIVHPILVAEVRALLDVPFEIWPIQKLADAIATAA